MDNSNDSNDTGFWSYILNEIICRPPNLSLILIILVLSYKLLKDRLAQAAQRVPKLPKIRRDFTLQELREYDGTRLDGRILIAVNRNVYDVSQSRSYYGPGGPYSVFGGRDASRCLGTFSVNIPDKDEYDDLSDLSLAEMECITEWDLQFRDKYDLVGRLLRPGEEPTNYSDEDDETPGDDMSETNSDTTETEVKNRGTGGNGRRGRGTSSRSS